MSSQIPTSRLSHPHGGCSRDVIDLLPLCESRRKSRLPLWMQMLVLYAVTRCGLRCWSRGWRLLSAMTYDTKLLLTPIPCAGLTAGPSAVREAAQLRRRRAGDDEEGGRFVRSEAQLQLGGFTSQLAFLHWAFVCSHASDERQERQLLHWLQETTSPCGTSP